MNVFALHFWLKRIPMKLDYEKHNYGIKQEKRKYKQICLLMILFYFYC